MEAVEEPNGVLICGNCGTKNPLTAQFCSHCDSYLGWDRGQATLDGAPLAGAAPLVVEEAPMAGARVDAPADADSAIAAPQDAAAPPPAPPPPPPGPAPPTVPPPTAGTGDARAPTEEAAPTAPTQRVPDPPAPPKALPPEIATPTIAIEITPGSTTTAALEIRNPSPIVDGYVLTPLNAPPWLLVTQEDAHLMPGEGRIITVTFGTRPGGMIIAQRLQVTLVLRSEASPEARTEVEVAITVPPQGPPASMEVTPTLLRLVDIALGSFQIRLDNRLANYPQRFALHGRDPEKVVQFSFSPAVVEVGPGQLVEAEGMFTVPAIDAGTDISRQLTISAANDAAELTALVTLLQRTSPAPEFVPVEVELAPSHLTAVDTDTVDFDVRIDNRKGNAPASLELHGQDPEDRARFAFTPARVTVPEGTETVVRARIRSSLPEEGETVDRPFSVIASHGPHDVEATGTLELTSTPSPLRTAELRMEPAVLNVGGSQHGVFRLLVDNRRGVRPLAVAWSGQSSDGTVNFRFLPPSTTVMPQSTGTVRVEVESPGPPPSQSKVSQLRITAADGQGMIETSATLVQSANDRRPLAKLLFVIIGALLMVIGAFMPWVDGDDYAQLADIIVNRNVSEVETAVAVAAHLAIVLLVVAILFGLSGKSGSLMRRSAVVAFLTSAGFAVYAFVVDDFVVLLVGLFVVWVGAVLVYIGGIFARPRR